MARFEREIRYVVIKLKDLDEEQKSRLYAFMDDNKIPQRDSVVVEDTNALYEPVWNLIKEQVENG